MKRIKHHILTAVLTLFASIVPVQKAEAQYLLAEAAADAALLAQQIAQFLNDWDFDVAKWKDYADKFKELEKIVNTLEDGSRVYSTVHQMGVTLKHIERVGRDAENYINYLEKYSTNFRVDRAYSIYKGFNRRTSNLYKEISKTVESIYDFANKSGDQSTSVSPIKMLNAVNEALEEFSNSVSEDSDRVKGELADLCLQTSIDESCEQNKEFLQLNVW